MNKVFLGGTCNGTTWRDDLIKLLQINYFNPVVEDWTEECQKIEEYEKDICNIHLYVITSAMTGVFSIAEVIDSVHTHGKRTILHIMPNGFNVLQLKNLKAVVNLVNKRGGIAYIDDNIKRTARVLNYCFQE